MSKNLRNCMKNMDIFCNTKCRKLKKSILKEMSKNDDYFKALFEIVHNISVNKLKIPKKDKRRMKKHIKTLEHILCNPKSRVKRASAVVQSGGFLPIILPILGTVLSGLIGNVISQTSDFNS
jgi:hypothetical protein